MAIYTVQGPDGHQYDIQGPDNATDEEITSQAQKLLGQSGGLAPINGQDKLQTFRNAISGILNGPQISTPPQEAFNQDKNGSGIQDATVGDIANVYSLYKTPEAIGGLYNLGKAGLSGIGNAAKYLKNLAGAPSAAEALAPAEDAMTAGTTAGAERLKQLAGMKSAVNDTYAQIPQDLRVATPSLQAQAADVGDSLNRLPKSFQSSKIKQIVSDLQDLKNTDLGTLKDMRSHLSDIAYNGEGTDRLYAGKLLNALNQDVEAASQTPLVGAIHRPASLAEGDIRSLWVDNAKQTLQPGLEEAQAGAHFVNPDAIGPLTNSDVGANLGKANTLYSSMQDVLQHPTAQALAKARPEEMAGVIFKPKATIEDLNVARTTLGPVGYNAVQGQFYNQLAKASDIGAKLSKYSPEFLQEALGPTKLNALNNLAKFNSLVAKAKAAMIIGGGAVGAGGLIKAGQKLF